MFITWLEKRRFQFSGAFYHIIVRGNQRQNIFLEPLALRSFWMNHMVTREVKFIW